MAFLRNFKQSLNSLRGIFRKDKDSCSSSQATYERSADNGTQQQSFGVDSSALHTSQRQSSVPAASSGQCRGRRRGPERREGGRGACPQTDTAGNRGGEKFYGCPARGRRKRSSEPQLHEDSNHDLRRPNTKKGKEDPGAVSGGKETSTSTMKNSGFVSDAAESDSDAEEYGVSKCQCSRNIRSAPHAGCRFSANATELSKLSAAEFYGETDAADDPMPDKNEMSFPSTSRQQQRSPKLSHASPAENSRLSSCSLEEQMDDLVSKLKTHGSLGSSRRRSRSRSRRSKTRQNCYLGSGSVIHNMTLIPTFPVRETDSDDSNTESRTSLPSAPTSPVPFLGPSFCRRNTDAAMVTTTATAMAPCPSRDDQSNSSFLSATGTSSEFLALRARSAASNRDEPTAGAAREEEEEEEEEGRMDWDTTASNTSGNVDPVANGSAVLPLLQELSGYGPEDFVLDLFLAMCRGTWSDIL